MCKIYVDSRHSRAFSVTKTKKGSVKAKKGVFNTNGGG